MIWTPFSFRSSLVAVVVGSMMVLVAGGCSDVSPFSEKQASCDLRPVDPQCTDWREFSGPSMVVMEQTCGSLTGAKPGATGYKADAVCPKDGMLGGCQAKSGDGSKQTNWFYSGDKYKTVDDAKKECDSNQEWVDPQ